MIGDRVAPGQEKDRINQPVFFILRRSQFRKDRESYADKYTSGGVPFGDQGIKAAIRPINNSRASSGSVFPVLI